MEKIWYESKTVQGILLALFGSLLGIWFGENTISATIIVTGLGYAGYGLRDSLTD